jgi:hypothetical protein
MKVRKGDRCTALSIDNFGARRVRVATDILYTGRFGYYEWDPLAITQGARWASGHIWTGTEILAPRGFKPRTIQLVASRYTKYANPASLLHVQSRLRMCGIMIPRILYAFTVLRVIKWMEKFTWKIHLYTVFHSWMHSLLYMTRCHYRKKHQAHPWPSG